MEKIYLNFSLKKTSELEKILEETKQKLEQTLANKANNGPKKGFALRNENHFIQSLQAKIIAAREILKYRKTQKN